MKRRVVITMLVLCLLFVLGVGCQPKKEATDDSINEKTSETKNDDGIDVDSENETATEKEETVKEGILPGFKAPDVTFITLEGDVSSLSDYESKTVVLNFWATWCGPCKVEIPHFNEYYKNLESEDVVVLGVNLIESDSKSDVAKAIEEYGIEYPIFYDEGNKASSVYRVNSIPTTIIINEKGIITEYYIGALSEDRLKELVDKAND